MNLKLLLPFQIFAEKSGVTRIVAETPGGSFGLLPHRLDCVAALAPGILIYESEGLVAPPCGRSSANIFSSRFSAPAPNRSPARTRAGSRRWNARIATSTNCSMTSTAPSTDCARVVLTPSFSLRGVEVQVDGVRQDTPPRMESIHYQVIVDTDESDHRLDLLHENVIKFGTVFNTVAPGTALSGVLRRKEAQT